MAGPDAHAGLAIHAQSCLPGRLAPLEAVLAALASHAAKRRDLRLRWRRGGRVDLELKRRLRLVDRATQPTWSHSHRVTIAA